MLVPHKGIRFRDFLGKLNEELAPSSYFEIGTHSGASLACFTCDALGVDPEFKILDTVWQKRGATRTHLFQMTSEAFFENERLRTYFPDGPDICFLDGLHHSEVLLRDFYNTEAISRPDTLIVLHDCLPLNERMARREWVLGDEAEEGSYIHAWTGDVWKVCYVLKAARPDLAIRFLDCPPSGLVLVGNLNPGSPALRRDYEAHVAMMNGLAFDLDELRKLYPVVETQEIANQQGAIGNLARRLVRSAP